MKFREHIRKANIYFLGSRYLWLHVMWLFGELN